MPEWWLLRDSANKVVGKKSRGAFRAKRFVSRVRKQGRCFELWHEDREKGDYLLEPEEELLWERCFYFCPPRDYMLVIVV